MGGLCGLCIPPSQSSSTSDSLACTSTVASIGDPSSGGVTHLGEQPSAVASESDHGSSKARRSSSFMVNPQSRGHHHLLGFGSPSSSPYSSSTSVDGGLGPVSSCSSLSLCYSSSSCPSSSSCSSSSSSIEEESSGQLTRWRAPSLTMQAPSWEMRGT